MKTLLSCLVIACLLVACSSADAGVAPTSTPNPNSPIVQQLGTLNSLAVGIAVFGGVLALALVVLGRRNQPDEDPDTELAETPTKASPVTSKKNKKKKRK